MSICTMDGKFELLHFKFVLSKNEYYQWNERVGAYFVLVAFFHQELADMVLVFSR